MKKRLLFISLALVLLLVTIAPASVFARENDKDEENFTAQADVYISNAGTENIIGQRGLFVFTHTTGEQLSGVVTNSLDWIDLTGAVFTMDVRTNNAKLNVLTGELTGVSSGTITLIAADGLSIMRGTFSACMSGQLDETGNPLFVNDEADFKLNGVSGVFKGVKAEGTATVQLIPVSTPYGDTFAGMMTLKGQLDD